jgi:hypothetical protein
MLIVSPALILSVAVSIKFVESIAAAIAVEKKNKKTIPAKKNFFISLKQGRL